MNAKTTPAQSAKARPANEFYRPKGYSPEESVGYQMRRILIAITQQIEVELQHTNLTNAQWVPLIKLYSGQASTVAELARQSQMDPGAMTRLLDRLEAKGLCRRVRNVEDRRVVNLELTDAGREAAKGLPAILCDVQNAHLAGFSHEEWDLLKSFLRRILDNAMPPQAKGESIDK